VFALALIAVLTFLVNNNNNISKGIKYFIYIIFMVILAVIIGFRPENTPDTKAYIYGFENSGYVVNQITMKNLFSRSSYGTWPDWLSVENGYWIIAFIFKKLFNSYHVFFTFSSFFCTFVIVVFLSKIESNNQTFINPIIMVLYIIFYGLMYSGVVMRAGYAIAFGVLSLYCLANKKVIKCIILLIIAFLFHQTAIFYIFVLAIYFIFKNKSSDRFNLFALLISFVLLLCVIFKVGGLTSKFFANTIVDYLSYLGIDLDYRNETTYLLGARKTIICISLTMVMLFVYKLKISINRYILVELLLCEFIIAFFSGFGSIYRIYDYILIFSIIPVSILISGYHNRNNVLYYVFSYGIVGFFALNCIITVFPLATLF